MAGSNGLEPGRKRAKDKENCHYSVVEVLFYIILMYQEYIILYFIIHGFHL